MTAEWVTTLVAAFVAVVVAMCALGAGVVLGRHPPRASCGRAVDGSCPCDPEARTCEWRRRR